MSMNKIKDDFEAVRKMVDEQMGKDYAVKNPGLIMHLLDKIQQHEDREVKKLISGFAEMK
jgi:hypothetical protein